MYSDEIQVCIGLSYSVHSLSRPLQNLRPECCDKTNTSDWGSSLVKPKLPCFQTDELNVHAAQDVPESLAVAVQMPFGM
jgi:hypothetical protein